MRETAALRDAVLLLLVKNVEGGRNDPPPTHTHRAEVKVVQQMKIHAP